MNEKQNDVEHHFGNSEVSVNAAGGKQSKMDHRFDLIDPEAIMQLAHTLDYGAKRYGEWNWLNIPCADHINHAVYHLYKHLDNDQSEQHLAHAFARVMFAMRMSKIEQDQVVHEGDVRSEPLFTADDVVAIFKRAYGDNSIMAAGTKEVLLRYADTTT